jgi:hypothetical protein
MREFVVEHLRQIYSFNALKAGGNHHKTYYFSCLYVLKENCAF